MDRSPHLVVCLAWVDLRPSVDPLTGEVTGDERWYGASAADRAALEWALATAERRGGRVTALTVGPPGAEAVLRDALAVGADAAVRVHAEPGAHDGPSGVVAAAGAAAAVLADRAVLEPADIVCCGQQGHDRAAAAFAAVLAHHLGAAQVTGCLAVELGDDGAVRAERRLDRGRRERVAADLPAVVSVEPGVARLRRASLAGVLAAADATIPVVSAPAPRPPRARVTARGPFRARSRELAPPRGSVRERIVAITGALDIREAPRARAVDPATAAELILEHLARWGATPAAGGSDDVGGGDDDATA